MKKQQPRPEESALAASLRKAPHDSDNLLQAGAIIDAGRGAGLFEALRLSYDADVATTVESMMPTLQAVTTGSARVGAHLMARLYPLAARSSHDVYMAIGLWMDSFASQEVAGVLRALAAEPVRPLRKKQYLAWAEHIAKASHR